MLFYVAFVGGFPRSSLGWGRSYFIQSSHIFMNHDLLLMVEKLKIILRGCSGCSFGGVGRSFRNSITDKGGDEQIREDFHPKSKSLSMVFEKEGVGCYKSFPSGYYWSNSRLLWWEQERRVLRGEQGDHRLFLQGVQHQGCHGDHEPGQDEVLLPWPFCGQISVPLL